MYLIECIRIAHFPWITVSFLSNLPIDCRKCNKMEIKSYIFHFPLSSNYFRINFLLIYCAEIRCSRNKTAEPRTTYDTRQSLSAIKTTCIWAKRSEFSIHTRLGRKKWRETGVWVWFVTKPWTCLILFDFLLVFVRSTFGDIPLETTKGIVKRTYVCVWLHAHVKRMKYKNNEK